MLGFVVMSDGGTKVCGGERAVCAVSQTSGMDAASYQDHCLGFLTMTFVATLLSRAMMSVSARLPGGPF